MAHKIKVHTIPHINKDGTESKTKKDYRVVDRHRGKTTIVGVVTSHKAVDALIAEHREKIVADHLRIHPNDPKFRAKHGLTEITKEN